MKLKFSIHYTTIWGQSVHVCIAYHYSNGRQRSYDLIMHTEDGDLWTLETSVMESRKKDIEYFEYTYIIEDQDGKVMRREWNRVPRRYYFDPTKNYILPDSWRDMPLQYHLMSKLCRTCDNRPTQRLITGVRTPLYRKTVIFHVLAPQLEAGQSFGEPPVGLPPAQGQQGRGELLHGPDARCHQTQRQQHSGRRRRE